MIRVTDEITFTMCEDGDDHAYGALKLTVTYGVTPGEPASGLRGPPEHYDPGSGDEVWIESTAAVVMGAWPMPADNGHAMAEVWMHKNRERIVEVACETAAGERDRAMEDAA